MIMDNWRTKMRIQVLTDAKDDLVSHIGHLYAMRRIKFDAIKKLRRVRMIGLLSAALMLLMLIVLSTLANNIPMIAIPIVALIFGCVVVAHQALWSLPSDIRRLHVEANEFTEQVRKLEINLNLIEQELGEL